MINQSIRSTERSLRDEFHIRKYHEASTYTLLLSMYLLLISCIAITALASNPWLSFLPWAAIGVAGYAGNRRMRKHVPTPVMPKPFSPGMIQQNLTIVALAITWIATFAWKVGAEASFIAGGIIGAVGALLITPYLTRKQHKRDTARIEAQLED